MVAAYNFTKMDVSGITARTKIAGKTLFRRFPGGGALVKTMFSHRLTVLSGLLSSLLSGSANSCNHFAETCVRTAFFTYVSSELSSTLAFSLYTEPRLIRH